MAVKALAFDVGDYVVYPKHGVGRVVELQREEIAGMQLELYVLRFEKERMTLRVPVNKVEAIGMRKLSSDKTLKEALDTLTGKPKVKRTMWSRRAQEYEAKINSGDLVSIAEVTRDLFRADDQPEQSYSNGRSSRPPRRGSPASSRRWRRPTSRARSRRFSRSSTSTRPSTTPRAPDARSPDPITRRAAGRPAALSFGVGRTLSAFGGSGLRGGALGVLLG
jgi:CarD family transcriptional regulator